MSNLFSVFDPASIGGLPLNWAASGLVLLACPPTFWAGGNQLKRGFNAATAFVGAEFSAILGSNHFAGATLTAVALFVFIGVNNAAGLAPYIFTSTSHPSVTLAIALPVWLGGVLLGAIKTPQQSLAHLVPAGSPAALAPFMVLIELTSNLIRPLTLAVRLAANMVAGHLLMALLSGPAVGAGPALGGGVLAGLVLLGVLEAAVATIQAYVFSTLTVLYAGDIASPELV